ncbi:MAG: putative membrane-bound dehydrogenase-like protein [Rhodothermales bacterium]|jgi:putative membrane-bound dehydrogenase-like protein
MRSPKRSLICLIFLALLSMPALAADPGFTDLFDGKTLNGWDGNPAFWRVEDGVITGQTTKEKPTNGNTFLVWQDGKLKDFVLRLKFKIDGGNSGVQYRSKEVGKWAIGGYQADFDASGGWAGTLYEEKGRGVLAKRGNRVLIDITGRKLGIGATATEQEIVESYDKSGWNDYEIIAKGNHLIQKLNGKVTVNLCDEQADRQALEGLLALQLHAGPPMLVQFKDIQVKELKPQDFKKVVFVAGRASHGQGAHEHRAGSMLLARLLNENVPEIKAEVVTEGWPADTTVFDGAAAVIIYCDGGGGHVVNPHIDRFDKLMKAGVGLACLHYGVEVQKGKSGDAFLEWIGGYFETHWSVNPHWTAEFKSFPAHPIAHGVEPFSVNDEWYFHMRFREGMKGVTPILSAIAPDDTMNRGNGGHSGNEFVRRAVAAKEPQHVAWAAERADGGRGFGFTGGHNHINWQNDHFRKIALNAIAWIAKVEVPASGVGSTTPNTDEMDANQDHHGGGGKPAAAPAAPKGVSAKDAKFASKVITTAVPGHAVDIDADIKGAKQLFLVVTDAGNSYACDWADWVEPRLVGPKGEKKLTELKWKSAAAEWGKVSIGKNVEGHPLRVNGKPVSYGIGTHANSMIVYDLPPGYERFKARGALDNGGTDQAGGKSTSVQFMVFTKKPKIALAKPPAPPSGGLVPAEALAALDVADGVAATVFASEPMMLSPSSIDIDHRGRVWVCEVMNYRRHKGKRPEGDRILILEDTTGDGKADKQTVFYQGTDIDSAHGVCVLGNRVIVSAGDKVLIFRDDNGDDKADGHEALFTGIAGAQHDHGIHAFHFGPDGRLYFNFGNSGRQIKDKAGKPIVDMAGNEVNDRRQPYQQGMAFRCRMDGSEFETLGWNFRNNWEAVPDSFGTVWQSDNDDDGNKGVRINYVMEFGNYGYRDEFTGAGWNTKRTNMHADRGTRHWHQNDPGVIPNFVQTGAGSPTGIVVYEGDLLPAAFRNQVIHCDAGPNIVRAYPATSAGAGYTGEMLDLLKGERDRWFRPSDVCVAPDGSLFVADWYDPGVGGHAMGDLERGRIYRVAPPGHKYAKKAFDFTTAAGAVAALRNANEAVRYMAWTALNKMQGGAKGELMKMAKDPNPRMRARALWLLASINGNAAAAIDQAASDENADVRGMSVRMARLTKSDAIALVKRLASDSSPLVRRECAIALRHRNSPEAAGLWAELAIQHDGKDRWYLEALGLAADGNWDRFFDAWLAKVGDKVQTDSARDIVWRSRAKKTPEYLVRILKDAATDKATHPRYMRAFDFQKGPERDAALLELLQ